MYRHLIFLFSFLAFSSLAQDPKPNFTGTWRLDVDSSLFSPSSEIDRIDHREPVMMIDQLVGRRADVSFGFTYRTDGGDSIATYRDRVVTRNAHWDGVTLVVDTKTTAHGVDSAMHEVMSLSEDGRVMTKYVHFSGPVKRLDERLTFKKTSDGIQGVAIGDSTAQVKHEWGEPEEVVEQGAQRTFIYKEAEVIFNGGKVSDIRHRANKP